MCTISDSATLPPFQICEESVSPPLESQLNIATFMGTSVPQDHAYHPVRLHSATRPKICCRCMHEKYTLNVSTTSEARQCQHGMVCIVHSGEVKSSTNEAATVHFPTMTPESRKDIRSWLQEKLGGTDPLPVLTGTGLGCAIGLSNLVLEHLAGCEGGHCGGLNTQLLLGLGVACLPGWPEPGCKCAEPAGPRVHPLAKEE
jgi:hypothetical protein